MSGVDLPESAWKAIKKLREAALESLCERTIEGIEQLASDKNRSFHARYLGLYELGFRQNKKCRAQVARGPLNSRRF